MCSCRDPDFLLNRTAHCAVAHPSIPHALLIFGGYGGRDPLLGYRNDVALLRLDRWVLLGRPPDHSFAC